MIQTTSQMMFVPSTNGDSMGYAEGNIVPLNPLGKLWKITIFIGKTHYKWPFSIHYIP